MSLIEEFKEPCVLLEKTRTTDGEGGWHTQWAEGAEFRAAIVRDTTMTARVAEHEGMTSVFTVTTDRALPLEFHDVFRRRSDGQVFRVTSDGSQNLTPEIATFQFSQVTAQMWELES